MFRRLLACVRASDPWVFLAFILLAIYPQIPGLNEQIRGLIDDSLGRGLTTLFIYAILALALHIVVGDAGLFHLGIGAFFGVGAYIAGILMVKVPSYPFQVNWVWAMLLSGLGTAALGIVLAAPTLRLRGDYLALVTLGFGEVIRFVMRNLDEITAGTKGLRPIPAPTFPGMQDADWTADFSPFYYFCLAFLVLTYTLVLNLERSRLGRAWVALREDELAASCMGMNTARLKLGAFALGMFLAGIAGSLYTIRFQDTADPDFYGFNISIVVLSCLILGGLGSRKGVLLGVLLIVGYNNIVADIADKKLQAILPMDSPFLKFGFWKMLAFGMVLILVMRFRPMGLLPASREDHSLNKERAAAPAEARQS
jgi:branched-chain amino acid transport system permease protein